MRVEWEEPDESKRAPARSAAMKEAKRSRERGFDSSGIDVTTPEQQQEVWGRRYPDLRATVTYFGTMHAVQYVPEQWMLVESSGLSGRDARPLPERVSNPRWVALVSTPRGTIEMDPTKLRIMWPCAPGDPIAGIVTDEELRKRALFDAPDNEATEREFENNRTRKHDRSDPDR